MDLDCPRRAGMVPALPIPVPVKVRLAAEISIDIMEEEEYPTRQCTGRGEKIEAGVDTDRAVGAGREEKHRNQRMSLYPIVKYIVQ
jgi:hypothetical protein